LLHNQIQREKYKLMSKIEVRLETYVLKYIVNMYQKGTLPSVSWRLMQLAKHAFSKSFQLGKPMNSFKKECIQKY